MHACAKVETSVWSALERHVPSTLEERTYHVTGAHVAVGAEVLHESVVVSGEERATRDVKREMT